MRWLRIVSLAAFVVLLGVPSGASATASAADCQFRLGFKALHDLIPRIVGDCVSDETHNPQNGDGLQQTSNGLLVWRKADNWTAFTDGARTWINGPLGLQERANAERFAWESAEPAARPISVQVYFSRHPESDVDFTAIFPRPRTVQPQGQRVASAAIEALVAGPTAEEAAQGYFTELGGMLSGPSTCEGQSAAVTVEDGLATVRFCRQTSSAGIGQDARVQSAIKATLMQFPTIHAVRILTGDGHCMFDASGEDRCLEPPHGA